MFAEMGVFFMPQVGFGFTDDMNRSDRGWTYFGQKFPVFRLEIERYIEESCSPECLTIRSKPLNIAPDGTATVIYTKYSLE
jgi:hypothetical protein